jgi:hypothetical protein
MAATQPATDYQTMLQFVYGNVHSLNESSVVLRDRLAAWRDQFFPLLNKDSVEEAKIHSWILPSVVMGDDMADVLTFSEVNALCELLSSQLAALAFNGYVNASIEADIVAAYNAAWT